MVEDPLTMDRHLSVIEMAELFAADDEDFPKDFPLSYAEIRYRQDNDNKIKELKKKPDECQFTDFKFGDSTYKLVTVEGKILLPESLQLKAVQWYHEMLLHPAKTRMELTITSTTLGETCARLYIRYVSAV